jgi:hypothetical protein
MKNILNFITDINESHQVEYRVSFLDFKDKNDNPITVSILVDNEFTDEFAKFLNDKEGELFFHAEGEDVEY